MHSSLLLLEPLDAIVNTQDRLKPPLSQILHAKHGKEQLPYLSTKLGCPGIQKGLERGGCHPPLVQNKKALGLVTPTDMEGKLQEI